MSVLIWTNFQSVVTRGDQRGTHLGPPRDQCALAFSNATSHLQSQVGLSAHSVNNGANMRSLRRSAILMEVRGGSPVWESTTVAQESPEGFICISHSRELTSAPAAAIAIHIRCAFHFSCGYYRELDLRDSVTNLGFWVWKVRAPFMVERWRRFRWLFRDFGVNLECYESAGS